MITIYKRASYKRAIYKRLSEIEPSNEPLPIDDEAAALEIMAHPLLEHAHRDYKRTVAWRWLTLYGLQKDDALCGLDLGYSSPADWLVRQPKEVRRKALEYRDAYLASKG